MTAPFILPHPSTPWASPLARATQDGKVTLAEVRTKLAPAKAHLSTEVDFFEAVMELAAGRYGGDSALGIKGAKPTAAAQKALYEMLETADVPSVPFALPHVIGPWPEVVAVSVDSLSALADGTPTMLKVGNSEYPVLERLGNGPSRKLDVFVPPEKFHALRDSSAVVTFADGSEKAIRLDVLIPR